MSLKKIHIFIGILLFAVCFTLLYWRPVMPVTNNNFSVVTGGNESMACDNNHTTQQISKSAEELRRMLFPPTQCPDGRFLSVIPGGNLGNLIWEYMSVFVLYQMLGKTYNLKPYVTKHMKDTIETVFQSLSIPPTSEIPEHCNIDFNHARIIRLNETLTADPQRNDPIILGQYSARYDEVLHFGLYRLRQELRFHDRLIESAKSKLLSIKESFQLDTDNVTYVGVHYRGTDYVNHLKKSYNKTVDESALFKFYVKAMNYFQANYNNVIFIFISIDHNWLSKYSPFLTSQFNVTFNPNGDSREEDFTILSYCNHSVINYGTFGATTAYFARGKTFLYDLKLPLDHRGTTVAMGMARILPDWFPL